MYDSVSNEANILDCSVVIDIEMTPPTMTSSFITFLSSDALQHELERSKWIDVDSLPYSWHSAYRTGNRTVSCNYY